MKRHRESRKDSAMRDNGAVRGGALSYVQLHGREGVREEIGQRDVPVS